MKINIIENHQLPHNKAFIFSNKEIKSISLGLEKIGVFKSNHLYIPDRRSYAKTPKTKGPVILTMSFTSAGRVYINLYGCEKGIIEQISTHNNKNKLISKLENWFKETLELSKYLDKHKELVVEVDSKTDTLRYHAI